MSIYKRQSDDIKNFDSAEEFLKYYENNRKDIDSTHTRSLNLKYKIDGHTIGRKQGKIILYPNKTEIKTEENSNDSNYEQLKNALLDLNERLKIIEDMVLKRSYYK